MKKQKPEISKTETIEGRLRIGKNGIGYLSHQDYQTSIRVPKHRRKTALDRDIVVVKVDSFDLDNNPVGKVESITKRGRRAYIGVLPTDKGPLELSGRSLDVEITVTNPADEALGKKVAVRIDNFTNEEPLQATATVVEILGEPGANDTEMNALAREKGFSSVFPPDTQAEADALEKKRTINVEKENRRDMRKIDTLTIDPEDAKDFDDALSFRELANGHYEVGIHIADVSFFVTPGSALDREAYERATSVYLVDRTISMLPEILSNDLCSLRPNEDKRAYSTVLTLDRNGKVIDRWFGRTVIHSNKRFTYQEAQEIIEAGDGPYAEALATLNQLAIVHRNKRFAEGALNLDSPEVKFLLDENGHPVDVYRKVRKDAHLLIEDFMLLANTEVAKFMAKQTKNNVFVYRIHDQPDEERSEKLYTFLKFLGYTPKRNPNGTLDTTSLNKIAAEAPDELKETIQTAIVRSMKKAIYSIDNIGHYGLGFTYYTHFTSPIRRYPDVLVHRLLDACIAGSPPGDDTVDWYRRAVEHSSTRERDAQEAEWASIAYKQIQYMTDRIGQEFDGVITGLSNGGIFVAEAVSRSEGMIRLSDLPNDFYVYEREKGMIIGQRTKKIFRAGDRVRIKVLQTNLDRGFIDYQMLDHSPLLDKK